MKTAVYPGTFDPVTYGHLDVILRASKLFDRVIVGVLHNSSKSPLFSVEERVNILKKATQDIPNVEVRSFSGLAVDFAKECQAHTIVRGLRAITDFEYELQMAQTNRVLEPEVDTTFLITSLEYAYLSSTVVKEVAAFGGDIHKFVPDFVEKEIEEYVESCKYQPLSTTKIVVNKEELEELLRELRLKTPDEIKRYQKIISNKDAILADAQNKADAIIAEAQAKAREMVEQSEVMQSAYAQANETVNNANQQAQEILDAATNDANSIRLGAIGYTDDMLANLSNIMTTALNDAGEKYNSFVESLTSCYNTVVQNRSELSPQGAPEEEQPEEEVVVPEYDPASEEESEEE